MAGGRQRLPVNSTLSCPTRVPRELYFLCCEAAREAAQTCALEASEINVFPWRVFGFSFCVLLCHTAVLEVGIVSYRLGVFHFKGYFLSHL